MQWITVFLFLDVVLFTPAPSPTDVCPPCKCLKSVEYFCDFFLSAWSYNYSLIPSFQDFAQVWLFIVF